MSGTQVRTRKPIQARRTPTDWQRLRAGESVPRHLHAQAYVAVVVEGSYWEVSAAGRQHLRPGDVAVHGPYGGHCNRVGNTDAVVMNLAVDGPLADSYGHVRDLDAVVRLAQRGGIDAGALVLSAVAPVLPAVMDWPDQLAADIAESPQLCLSEWAQRHGLAQETVSRGFKRAYGAKPKQVRAEHRARRALAALLSESTALAQLSLDAGFPDQACMTHAIRALTGLSPLMLRRQSNGDKTSGR
jgi:AraC-like DNA-binding protein